MNIQNPKVTKHVEPLKNIVTTFYEVAPNKLDMPIKWNVKCSATNH